MITSNCVFPGHQCCGPSAVNNELKYSSSGGCASALIDLGIVAGGGGFWSHSLRASVPETGKIVM
jgi:hypothetical protein